MKKTIKARLNLLLVAISVLVFGELSVNAATQNVYTWVGDGDGTSWFDADNWNGPSGAGVPGDTQDPDNLQIDGAFANGDSNVTGVINYTPVAGSPTNISYFSFENYSGSSLVLNIDGRLVVEHNNVSTPSWYSSGTSFGGHWSSTGLKLNINDGGFFGVKYGNFYVRNATVNQGGQLVGAMDGTLAPNRSFRLYGDTEIFGWCGTLGVGYDGVLERLYRTSLEGNLTVDGGTFYVDCVSQSAKESAIVITNTAVFQTRYGGDGIIVGYYPQNGNYNNTLKIYDGVVTNRGVLEVASCVNNYTSRTGVGTINISGGTFFQGGAVYLGNGRVGELFVSGGVIEAESDVMVGGAKSAIYSAPDTGIDYGGILTIDGGDMKVINPLAGVVRTAVRVGRDGGGRDTHYFGTALDTWDYTYNGQRLIIDSLVGDGNGLQTDFIYYQVAPNIVAYQAKSTFAMSLTIDGDLLTGTESYSAGCTYYTLPARLMIGNEMTFSDTTLMNTGTLNMVSGSLLVDELIATNGAASIINFSGGILESSSSSIDTGSTLVVGDGESDAVFNTQGGTHVFADGLMLNTNATLELGTSVEDINITGDVVFAENSIIDCDLGNDSGDQVTVTGDVELPTVATVELDATSMDNLPDVVELITASSISGETDLSGWIVESVGETRYTVSVDGSILKLSRVLNGSLFIVR